VPIADVAGVVIAHRHDHVAAHELVQEPPALLELAAIVSAETAAIPRSGISEQRDRSH
jgi:hypothetical protein